MTWGETFFALAGLVGRRRCRVGQVANLPLGPIFRLIGQVGDLPHIARSFRCAEQGHDIHGVGRSRARKNAVADRERKCPVAQVRRGRQRIGVGYAFGTCW